MQLTEPTLPGTDNKIITINHSAVYHVIFKYLTSWSLSGDVEIFSSKVYKERPLT